MSKVQLSSKLTFTYKYILPILFLVLGLCLLIFGLIKTGAHQQNNNLPVIGISFIILSSITLMFFSSLKFVHHTRKHLIIKGFKETKKIENWKVIAIKKMIFPYGLFEIEYETENELRSAYFIPRLSQSFFGFFTPLTIQEYRKRIGKKN